MNARFRVVKVAPVLLSWDSVLDVQCEENAMKALFNRFAQEEAGQDLIEYGLLVGIITIGAIAAIQLIGPKVAAYFTDLDAAMP